MTLTLTLFIVGKAEAIEFNSEFQKLVDQCGGYLEFSNKIKESGSFETLINQYGFNYKPFSVVTGWILITILLVVFIFSLYFINNTNKKIDIYNDKQK
jgi:hypothetical protein